MEARFRIRTHEGRLLEPRTIEIFAELVRSGMVRPEDEVFDALTGAWTRAELHPMVALFRDPLVTHPEAERLSRRIAEEARADAEEAPPPPDIRLEIVSPEEKSPEEAQRAFIRKMEDERRYDAVQEGHGHDLPLVTAESSEVRRGPERHVERPFGGPHRAPPQRKLTPARPNRVGVTALFVVLVGAALVLARVARPALRAGEAEAENATAAEPMRSPRAVTRTEEQIRQDAFAGFVDGVDALGAEIAPGEVPRAWLEGAYLADPSAYPEVRPYWERYEAYVDAAQAREAALYRESYLAAATLAGVAGSMRSLRMATALEDFASSRPGRLEHYARVRELAESALALHDLVVELQGRISYEPIRGPRVSADPVIEAAGIDPQAQARLDAALDRLLVALHGNDGTSPRDRQRIPGWLVEGLRQLAPQG